MGTWRNSGLFKTAPLQDQIWQHLFAGKGHYLVSSKFNMMEQCLRTHLKHASGGPRFRWDRSGHPLPEIQVSLFGWSHRSHGSKTSNPVCTRTGTQRSRVWGSFEGDLTIIAEALNRGNYTHVNFGSLIKDTQVLARHLCNHSFLHVKRKGNSVAHALARQHCITPNVWIWNLSHLNLNLCYFLIYLLNTIPYLFLKKKKKSY